MVGCCVLLLPSLAFADTYAITYEMNGGTNYSDAPSNYEAGTGVIINGYPTKTDYTFAGWCTDSELADCKISQTIGSNDVGDKTFYAKWTEAKFVLETTSLSANKTFNFKISAAGTFTVDCGNGGVLSGDGVDGNTITRSETSIATYTCSYSAPGVKTIVFDGLATGYGEDVAITFNTQTSTNNGYTNPVNSISGSLGAIFPTLGSSDNQIPNFYGTFKQCRSLRYIPVNLFKGVTGVRANLFRETFDRCDSLEYIPTGLFDDIIGPGKDSMFRSTFNLCLNLRGIPDGLFAGVTSTATNLFRYLFYGDTAMTGYIGPNVFAGLIANGSITINNTVWTSAFTGGNTLDTTCPEGTKTYNTGYESYWSSKVSCLPKDYDIIYELDGGVNFINAPASYKFGIGTTIDGIPTKSGNVFVGWCVDSDLTDCSMIQTIKTNAINTKTFYAKWLPCTPCNTTNASCELSVENNECTYTTECYDLYENIQNNGRYDATCSAKGIFITYVLNGGINYVDAPRFYHEGIGLTINGVPTKTGHTFMGWCIDSELTTCSMTQTITAQDTEPKTFYAKWNVDTYDITYEMDNGVNYENAPATYTYGVGAMIDGVPTKTGQAFAGWCVDPDLIDCSMTQIIEADAIGNKTFYAKWKDITFPITYVLNGGRNYNNAPTEYIPGNGVIINGIPNKDAHTFVGWCVDSDLTDCSMTQTIGVEATGNRTFYAKWSECTPCEATNANCEIQIVNNACTYMTSCIIGYGDIQNTGQYNPSCVELDAIIYILNGGTNYENAPGGYTQGTGATVNGIPTKNHSVFMGWCKDIELQNCAMTQIIGTNARGNQTFYAKWSECPECATTNATCEFNTVVNNVCTYTTSCEPGYSNIQNDGEYNASCGSVCGLTEYYDSSKGACLSCPKGYNSNTDGKNSISQCQIHCDGGQFIPTYTQVAFLQGNGEANGTSIDTGYQIKSTNVDINVVVGTQTTVSTNNDFGNIFGNHGTINDGFSASYKNKVFGLWHQQNTVDTKLKSDMMNFEANQEYHIHYTINGTARSLTVNNYVPKTDENALRTNTPDTATFKLFSNGGGGKDDNLFKGRIYSLQLRDNDELVLDLISVRRNRDGVLGFYNKVDGEFYVNAGGGQFIAGNDVSPTQTYSGNFCQDVGDGYYIAPNTTSFGSIALQPGKCPNDDVTNKQNATSVLECSAINCPADNYYNLTTSQCTPCPVCAATNATCSMSVEYNVCTYETVCNTNYENIQNNGAYNASCSPIMHNITYVMDGGTNYSGAPTSYHQGTGATINGVPTKTDYTFLGWCMDAELTNCAASWTISTSDTTDKVFFAKWQLDVSEYTITYELNGGTNYENAPNIYVPGIGVTINGVPTKANTVFVGWCTDAELTDCALMQRIDAGDTGNKTFYAKWGCAGGYYMNNDVCTQVGVGYYSEPSSTVRYECPNGLTTIGFGPGADEFGDCGRVLHIGNYILYLRTTRGTDRTLNVQIGNNLYYGNMSTDDMNMSYNVEHQFKLTVDGTTYSVYDDSASPYMGN